jgi:dihydroorotase-like cyclic amidohydrolase
VVFDDASEFVISREIIRSRHKITPYEGRKVTGRVERTLLRGSPIFANGEMVGSSRGRPILRETNRDC